MVLLAALMCVVGSFITVRLWRRTLQASGRMRVEWSFLTGVTAGAAIWATHFIAMLGYLAPVPITFDAQLTIFSIVIAIAGSGLGFYLSGSARKTQATLVGGATIGLSIAAMHYVGMFAYRADGVVSWSGSYIAASIACAIGFAVVSTGLVKASIESHGRRYADLAILSLVVAIVTLHFTGMTAFSVSPIAGLSSGADSEAFQAMAMAVAVAATIIVFTGLSSHVIDNDTRAANQRELEHIASHDELTGLWNRRQFSKVLAERCSRGAGSFHLVMIDLDRFKPVNDTLGHGLGDRALKVIAARIRHVLPEGTELARLGGDEFAFIADGMSAEEITGSCRRLVEILARPVIAEGHVIELGASMGIARAFENGATPDELIQNADIALYAAKAAGRSCHQFFEERMSEKIQLRRSLELDMRRAISRDELEVHYQPKVDAKTGAFTGAEALVRWNHHERGQLSPALFVPLAEELGLINAIGAWVLARACTDASSWPAHMSVAVNLSPVQIMDRRLVRTLRQILKETGFPPQRLELEITETALLGNDVQALATLTEIRALGVKISLDDFGTGYSSLSYLHRFPIDRIKIDRSFVARTPSDAGSASIIQAIARLGASLGIKVTAEGIETESQRDFSSAEGCNELQGYLISRPVPHHQLEALFAKARSEAA
ncbi:putative bifunctional diguanylate cyclase/phosphodiesterase [Jiella endophytica]|nr:EAL domain-containing protein [Jiella endophytica]